MAKRSTEKFTRLSVTVPSFIAEAYGAALIELGAGSVEECPASHPSSATLVVTLPGDEPVEPWQSACAQLSTAFAEEAGLDANRFTLTTEACELDYHDEWLRHLSLVRLTPSLVLAPVDDATATPEGSERLLFVPEPSFGDGTHVTTRLASTAVEVFCEAHPGARVLDVGTGNGVLSLVAARRGARALGLDIDDAAVEAAQRNAQLNSLDETAQFSSDSVASLEERFPCVVCNLEPLTQLELARAIAARVEPQGTLILTGFLEEQVPAVVEPYLTQGFVVLERATQDDYALVRLEAPRQWETIA